MTAPAVGSRSEPSFADLFTPKLITVFREGYGLDGLRAEGEAAVRVHWALAEDIHALKRVHDAVAAGRPLPMALREARIWGTREKLFERAVPLLPSALLDQLVSAASVCDGLVKGLKHPDWPPEPWDALRQLMLRLLQPLARPEVSVRLALHA